MLDHRYHTFLTLTKTGSYTATADRLFISQPAVTQQIKSLEHELGVQLVSYHRPHLEITTAGHQLALFVASLEVQSQQMIKQIKTATAERQISFVATLSVSEFLVPQLILKLKQQGYTNINCQTANTQVALQQLDDGSSQFALIEGNFDKANYDYQIIRQEPFIGVAAASNPLVQQTDLRLANLLSEPLLLREVGSGTRDIFQSLAQSQNISITEFKQLITIDNPTVIRELLLQDVGISFMYQSLVKTELATGRLTKLPLKDLQLQHELVLVWPKNSYFAAEYEQLLK